MIELRNFHYAYQSDRSVLSNITLTIGPGEVVNVLGPNGCGKTTLLKSILGFLTVPPGTVLIDGSDIQILKRRDLALKLAYVPQSHGGIFNYKALDVVMMGRTPHSPWHSFKPEDYDRAMAALAQVRAGHLGERAYLQLSGGERQLVLIARALAQNSETLIMDEPVSGLDYGNQFHLLTIIRELSLNGGPSFVLTTHHPEQAVFLGGRAVLLKNGTLHADGPSREIITNEAVCDLYGVSREMLAAARMGIH